VHPRPRGGISKRWSPAGGLSKPSAPRDRRKRAFELVSRVYEADREFSWLDSQQRREPPDTFLHLAFGCAREGEAYMTPATPIREERRARDDPDARRERALGEVDGVDADVEPGEEAAAGTGPRSAAGEVCL
jgi:hypothetical protein